MERQAEDSVSEFVQLYSINHYVTSCLDSVTTEGLQLLGEQGGVIYESQGGLTPDQTTKGGFVKGVHYIPYDHKQKAYRQDGSIKEFTERKNVTYAIKRFVNCPSFYPPQPAELDKEPTSYYPVKDTGFDKYVSRYMSYSFEKPPGCFGYDAKYQFSGFLGANLLPKLCYINGSNKPYEDRDFADPTTQRNPCRWQYYDSFNNPTSMQHQLESYVQENIGSCVNLSVFTRRAGNISVNDEAIDASSTLQDPNGILMKVHYPFEVKLPNGNAYEHEVAFKKEFDVNIKTLYSYIFDLFTKMTRDPSFELFSDWNVSNETANKYYHSTFELDYEEQACADCSDRGVFDDIITITDQGSLLNRKPFSMTFAIQDRKPVLDYLNDEHVTSNYKGMELDYQFFTNSTITFEPEAIDPDYDNISYTYKGWKEDYDEVLNYTCCQESDECTLENYKESGCYELQEDVAPRNWTRSDLFVQTGRKARYQSDINDTGYHNVTVIVEDEHGKKDFQIIKFIIFDLPQALLEMKNFYDDVNNNFASVEDLYLLNGSASNASNLLGGEIDNYIFRDMTEHFIKNTTEGAVLLEGEPANFSNTGTYNFTREFLDDNKQIRHEISLIVEQNDTGSMVTSTPVYGFVNVSQCLPHGLRNEQESETGSFSQQYYTKPDIDADEAHEIEYYWEDDFNDDPYQVPHVCCEPLEMPSSEDHRLGGGKWLESSTTCFETVFNSTFPSPNTSQPYAYLAGAWLDVGGGELKPYTFERYEDSYGNPSHDLYPTGFDIESEIPKYINDIYTVEYKHKCSGTSGKMCAGELDVSWTPMENCNDLSDKNDDHQLNPRSQFARCQGPGSESDKPFTERFAGQDVDGALVCANFSRTKNYEKDVLGINSTNYEEFEYFDLEEEEAELIEKGYCAYPKWNNDIESTDEGLTITHDNSGSFKCEAACEKTTGECGYHSYEDCSCDSEDNQCDGIPASKLFDEQGNEYEVCISGGLSCDSDCQRRSADFSKGACHCATEGEEGDVVSEEEVKAYFESIKAKGDINSVAYPDKNTHVTACCTDDKVILPMTESKVCFNGNVFEEEPIGNNPIEGVDMLASEGKIHCCCQGDGCPPLNYCTEYHPGQQLEVDETDYLCRESANGPFWAP